MDQPDDEPMSIVVDAQETAPKKSIFIAQYPTELQDGLECLQSNGLLSLDNAQARVHISLESFADKLLVVQSMACDDCDDFNDCDGCNGCTLITVSYPRKCDAFRGIGLVLAHVFMDDCNIECTDTNTFEHLG